MYNKLIFNLDQFTNRTEHTTKLGVSLQNVPGLALTDLILKWICQWFPTFSGLRHPTKQKYNFRHLVANP